ncbi:MAG: aldehyde ferredoxin oxidoreductase family protein [Chloroflexi bacterium]|nr:aldehyde ferredoxin oxidoreductase family protein [Chloroflexota bacterium]
MSPGGYTGKILRVDLSSHSLQVQDLDDDTARRYLGGEGFAAKILWETTTSTTDPLSPENPLMFMTGPLTGSVVPASSRYIVAGLSPLTGVWGAAHSGGSWGAGLKRAGFDGIVLTGKSRRPVYLWINDGQARILDAGHVWGRDTWETDEVLRKETDSRASVASIGPAGERLVRFAAVLNDGRDGRAAARCGMGALMGSKNLKAVVVSGGTRPRVSDEDGLKKSIHEHLPPAPLIESGLWRTTFAEHRRVHWNVKGRGVIKNFLDDDFHGFLPKLTESMLSGEPHYCFGCRYSCADSHNIGGRRSVVYEALVPLGSQCLIDDLEALQEAFDLCQRYGMDSISAGGVVAFAIEAFEKGMVTAADTGGVQLRWGNAAAMVEMVRQIGESEQKFARLLGQGVRQAAETLGGVAAAYAMHVKGLELPAHDPRSSNALALEYATANRGADHVSAFAVAAPDFLLRDLGLPENQDSLENRFRATGRAEVVARLQDFRCMMDCLSTCKLMCGGLNRADQHIAPSNFAEFLSLATGWNMTLDECLKIGRRIFNLQRMINVRRGLSRKDDMLPPRIMVHTRGGKSDAAYNLPPLGEMLNEYYAFRGWSEEGIPTGEKLEELGLDRTGLPPPSLFRACRNSDTHPRGIVVARSCEQSAIPMSRDNEG